MEETTEKENLKIVPRVIASFLLVTVWGWFNFLSNTVDPLVTARAALKQFENSDSAYVASQYGMRIFSFIGAWTTLGMLALLVFLWWKPAKSLIKMFALVALLVVPTLLSGTQAHAYYEKTDTTEMFYVRPNWSVFWVPDNGANLDSQGHMDTEEFYAKNRIPAKAFKIPHHKIEGSTGMGERDYYGPDGRMYVVDRSAFNRRWTASSGTGTSPKDQSIHAQTKEGINVTVETSISAKVLDKNAPKYLFWWGTDLVGKSNDPNVVFASVLYARPLASVMDEVVLGEAHRLLFDKIAVLTVDDVNTNAKKIMSETFTELKEFCAEGGIDLVSFGSAGTFTFDKDVQQALNDRYTAQVIEPYIGTLKEKAYIDAMNGWDHKLPASLTVWSLAGLKDLFGGHDAVKSVEIPKADTGKK